MQHTLLFTKEKSLSAKGICILIMLAHHLFAFPDRIDYVFDLPFWVWLGREFGLIVGLYVFISGYGLAVKPLTFRMGGGRILNLWLTFIIVFAIFVPIGIGIGVYDFDLQEFLENLFLFKYSYNHEWWFLGLYIKLIVISCFLSLCKNKKLLGSVIVVLLLFVLCARKVDLSFVPLDIKLHLPVFLLGYCTCKYSLFEVVDGFTGKYIRNVKIRILVYVLMAYIIGHAFAITSFLQYFFWFLAFSLIMLPVRVTSVLHYLGKYSLYMWLVHTFFCYYFCKEMFVAIHNPLLGYLVLLVLSILTSIVSWKIDYHIKRQISYAK